MDRLVPKKPISFGLKEPRTELDKMKNSKKLKNDCSSKKMRMVHIRFTYLKNIKVVENAHLTNHHGLVMMVMGKVIEN